MQNGTQSVLTLNSWSGPSRDQKSFLLPLLFHTQGKAKYNEVEENRAELVTPSRCHSVFKVPVVPLAYLRPVNLTQPSSREDLGSNKGLTPWSPGLRLCWRRWLASPRPPSPHAIPAPAMSFPFLPLPSFTPSLVSLHPLFSAAFVPDLFYPLSYLHCCFVFVTFATFFFKITIISSFCFSFHLFPCVSLFLAFSHIFNAFNFHFSKLATSFCRPPSSSSPSPSLLSLHLSSVSGPSLCLFLLFQRVRLHQSWHCAAPPMIFTDSKLFQRARGHMVFFFSFFFFCVW